MKHLHFTLLLLLATFITAVAHDFEAVNSDGVTIYYNYNDDGNSVSVTYKGPTYDAYYYEYSGKVVLPEEVTYNGKTYAVTAIGERAFFVCPGMTEITISNSITSIGELAFCDCSGLTEITFPESITTIGVYAFPDCVGLTSVNIPNSVTSIGTAAFSHCSNLTSIVVESGNPKYDSRDNSNAIIETASNTLIAGCQNTDIPESVTSIGDYAFCGCSNLSSITIGNSITSIGELAFAYCHGLTSVNIPPNSVTSIARGTFYDCVALTSIIIPEAVTSIGDFAFSSCLSLTSITIPNSVITIGDFAFSSCSSLTSITIPASVTTIGASAFFYCNGLTEVTIFNENPSNISLGEDVFGYVATNMCTLYVPKGSKELYATADVWKEFGTIEEIDLTSIDAVTRDTANAQYYDLKGYLVSEPQRGNIYIKVVGETATKVVF